MTGHSFIELAYNISLLLAVALLFDLYATRWTIGQAKPQQILIGIFIGATGLVIMSTPWTLMQGVVFDTRSVLLGISGLFFGTLPTIIAITITSVYRFQLGGEGAWTGVSVIIVSGVIGLLWRHLRIKKLADLTPIELLLFGFIIHIAMLALMLTLPWKIAPGVLARISLPVLFIYPLGTALLGGLLTKRMRREERDTIIRESEERYRILYNTVLDPILVVTAETGTVIDCNNAAQKFFARSYSEIIGTLCTQLHLHDNTKQDTVANQLKLLLSTPDKPQIITFRLYDGQIHLAEVNAARFLLTARQLVLLIFHDITKQKTIEEALRHSEERYKIFAEDLPALICEYTQDGTLTFVNRAYAEYFNLPFKSLVGKCFLDFIPMEELAKVQEGYLSLTPEQPARIHTHAVSKDGVIVWHEWLNKVFFNEQREPIKYLGIGFDISERRQIEESLQMKELEQRTLINGLPDIIMRFDLEGRLSFISENINDFLELELNKVLTSTYHELDLPESLRLFLDRGMKYALKSNTTYEDEFSIQGKKRTSLFNWRLIPVRSPSGQITTFLSVARDITDHRRLEQDYQNLFKEMLDGFALHEIICDEKGRPKDYRFLAVNPSFERMTGLRRENIIGNTVIEVLPGTEEYWINAYGKVALTGQPLFFENYSSELDKYFEVTAFCPNPGQFACIFTDVTDRRKAEDDFHRIFTMSLDMICVADIKKAIFIRVNPAFTATLGFAEEDFVGKSFFDYVHPDDVQPTIDVLQQHLKQGGKIFNFENRYRCKSGEYRWLNWISHPQIEKGVTYAIARDVTERKEHELAIINAMIKAEAANKAKSIFLANMSHEIRTPLNGLMGMLQLLNTTSLDDEQQNFLKYALQSSNRLTRLLTDILDLSRVEAGKMVLFHEPFDVKDVIDSIIQLFSPVAIEKELKLQFRVSQDVPATLVGDAIRLQQIMNNLVGNAIKFTNTGAIKIDVITLSPRVQGECRLLISIEDTGIGISDNNLNRLFTPFTQVEGSCTRNFQGAGLGLTITKKIVELMDGNISVVSEEDTGSIFYISIPFKLMQNFHDSDIIHENVSIIKNLHVLLVEDDKVSQLVTIKMLTRHGYQVDVAIDGRQAINKLQNNNYDIVLMDVQLPILDGIEVTKAIRQGAVGNEKMKIPIIAMTAYAMYGDKEKFLEAGMNGYVSKPIDLEVLMLHIKKVFSSS